MLSSIQTKLRSPLVPLSLLILIDHIGFGIFFPILVPLFMDPQGILGPDAASQVKSFWYNVTLSVFPVALFFGSTLLGSLSDQFGRKKILILCLLGAILSYFLAGVAIDYMTIPLLIVSRAIAGLAAGSMPIAQAAIVDISDERERGSNLGLIILAASVGFLIGPLLGGFFANANIVSWFSYSTPFYIAALLAFVNLCFLLRFFKETFAPKKAKKFRWQKCVELSIAPFKVKNIRFLSFIFLLVQLGWSFYFQFISLFLLKRYQYSAQDISLFMTLMGIGFAVGSCWALRILSRYFKDITLALASLGIIVFSLLIIITELHLFANWVSSFWVGVGMAVLYSLMIKFFSCLVSEQEQGWIMGVSEAIVSVAWAITPLASTYLENIELSLPLQVATVLLGASMILLCFWKAPVLQSLKPNLKLASD